MSYPVPTYLRSKIDDIAANIGQQGDLAEASGYISRKYRRLEGQNLQISSKEQGVAYLLTRFPATYAAVSDVLSRIKVALPDFSPRSILDIGAGPATATLAAQATFGEDIPAQLIEMNLYLRELGQELLGADAVYNPQTIQSYKEVGKHDLVLASYVLNELPEAEVIAITQKYWEICDGVMVILEPGTPQVARLISLIREHITKLNESYIIGPCPQSGVCPLQDFEKRWCHFSVRVERSRRHKQLKGGDMGYEDEKFAWLAISRKPAEKMPSYRVIGHPTGTGVRQLQVCTKDGTAENLKIPKSHPQYKKARKAEWGDALYD